MYTECVHNTYVRTYVCTYTGGSPVSHSGSCPELHDSLSFAKNVKTICTYVGCVVLYIRMCRANKGTCTYLCTYARMYVPASSSVLAHFAACGRRPLTRETGTDRPKGVVRECGVSLSGPDKL